MVKLVYISTCSFGFKVRTKHNSSLFGNFVCNLVYIYVFLM